MISIFDDEKKVNVNPCYVRTEVCHNSIKVGIVDAHKETRKLTPIYVMEIDLDRLGCVIRSLLTAWVELKKKKLVRLKQQHNWIISAAEGEE